MGIRNHGGEFPVGLNAVRLDRSQFMVQSMFLAQRTATIENTTIHRRFNFFLKETNNGANQSNKDCSNDFANFVPREEHRSKIATETRNVKRTCLGSRSCYASPVNKLLFGDNLKWLRDKKLFPDEC